MKVVILAGGFGTRLSEETITKPKPTDTLHDKNLLEDLWAKGEVPWKKWD
jgi:NDP-sugar pyrophosphorylase family protein